MSNLGAEKLTLGFLADVLYIQGVICLEAFEDILRVKDASDLDIITEKLLRSEYNVFKRGEYRSQWESGGGSIEHKYNDITT